MWNLYFRKWNTGTCSIILLLDIKYSGTMKHAINILNDEGNKTLRPLLCAIARFNILVKISELTPYVFVYIFNLVL